ncbi:phage baseplate assembly protein V [Rhodobacter sp. CZR27]|uniref:phage baseplate assembly protein V n=1 Tax=Rhodobacter sp. CZR27 TaxID=2033869 RepID=UPI000BBEC182|nr:phage baseplate assembly protein V [Rhodobacter sp. CZR27]
MDEFVNALDRTVRQQRTKYWGKYRAFVQDNADPEALGRIRLTIPSVLGEAASAWALPCVPYGGGQDFGMLAIPPVGAQVLAEFLEGDISSPVWVGTFWRQASELPAESAGKPEVKILKTETGHRIVLDDTEGSETVTIHSKAEAEIVMDKDGAILLTDSSGGKVTLDAQGSTLTVEDANGNSITLSSTGIACKDANGNEITTSGSGVTIKSSATINIEGSQVTVAGAGGEPLIKGTTFLSMFNTHVHNATSIGAPTSPPIVPLTPSVLTTKSTAQ